MPHKTTITFCRHNEKPKNTAALEDIHHRTCAPHTTDRYHDNYAITTTSASPSSTSSIAWLKRAAHTANRDDVRRAAHAPEDARPLTSSSSSLLGQEREWPLRGWMNPFWGSSATRSRCVPTEHTKTMYKKCLHYIKPLKLKSSVVPWNIQHTWEERMCSKTHR